jgi:hypothetical protein
MSRVVLGPRPEKSSTCGLGEMRKHGFSRGSAHLVGNNEVQLDVW